MTVLASDRPWPELPIFRASLSSNPFSPEVYLVQPSAKGLMCRSGILIISSLFSTKQFQSSSDICPPSICSKMMLRSSNEIAASDSSFFLRIRPKFANFMNRKKSLESPPNLSRNASSFSGSVCGDLGFAINQRHSGQGGCRTIAHYEVRPHVQGSRTLRQIFRLVVNARNRRGGGPAGGVI